MLAGVISEFILPPALIIFTVIAAATIRKKYPRVSIGLFVGSIVVLYLLSTPLVTALLMAPLQHFPALSEQQIQADSSEAIVVLGAGRKRDARDFNNADTISTLGLERVRYAAWLKRRTHLPLIVSGGKVEKNVLLSEAQLMRDVLQKEFLVEVNFMEQESRNTYENALYTAKLLKDIGVTHIFLVSHAWHLRRAVASFEQQGVSVLAAPTAYYGNEKFGTSLAILDFFPNSKALYYSYFALHEYMGYLWYKMYYGI